MAGPDRLAELVDDLAVDEILLAMPSGSRKRRTDLLEMVRGLEIAIRTLPDLLDIVHGKVAVSDLRSLQVEDLLGRDPVTPDIDLMRRIVHGKCVLITGAGGSIGSELCRQVWEIGPRLLLLVDPASSRCTRSTANCGRSHRSRAGGQTPFPAGISLRRRADA